MSGKIFDLTPESEGPRHPVRRAASWDYGRSDGEVYLARKMALEQAADDALLGAQWVVRRRAAQGQGGGEDAVTLALTLRRHGVNEEEWEREVRRAVALQAEGTAYLARKREERLRRQAAEVAEAGVLQAQAEVGREGGALSPVLSGRIGAKRGGGQPLEATVRQGMEGVFGVSFGHVRIHADSEADALNRGVAAIAFTVGSDIFFRAGFYQPHSTAGQHLLAHELTHVVQQRTGSLGTSGGGGANGGTMTVGAADDRHEQEAEQTAHRVTAALQRRALLAQATTPGAGLARRHDPTLTLTPAAQGVRRAPLPDKDPPVFPVSFPAIVYYPGGANIHTHPAVGSPVVALLPSLTTRVMVTGKTTTSGQAGGTPDWYAVRVSAGPHAGTVGFLQSFRVDSRWPTGDPDPTLYVIQPGDTALGLAARFYGLAGSDHPETNADLRRYVEVLVRVNQHGSYWIEHGNDGDPLTWMRAQVRATYAMWVPSRAWAGKAAGAVPNPSLTGGAWATVHQQLQAQGWGGVTILQAVSLFAQDVAVVGDRAVGALRHAIVVSGTLLGEVTAETARAVLPVLEGLASAAVAPAVLMARLGVFLTKTLAKVPAALLDLLTRKAHELLAALLGPQLVTHLGGAVQAILADPGTFIGNLGKALGTAVTFLLDHVRTNWGQDLLQWLVGKFGAAIPLPTGLDLSHLGPQTLLQLIPTVQAILGLTEAHVRGLIVAQLAQAERITPGVAAQRLATVEGRVGRLSDLAQRAWATVAGGTAVQAAQHLVGTTLDNLRGWVMQSVIAAAVTKVAQLCAPLVGQLIGALQAIYGLVQTVLENKDTLRSAFDTIVGQFAQLAAHKDAAVAVGIGKGIIGPKLVTLIPAALSFLAKLLGLGNVQHAIEHSVKPIQDAVDRALTTVIGGVVRTVRGLLHGHGGATTGAGSGAGQQHQDNPTHAAIAQAIVTTLEHIEGAPKDFAATRTEKESEAGPLKARYQPQLEKGINLSITFATAIDTVGGEDTLDVTVLIAPNDTKKIGRIRVTPPTAPGGAVRTNVTHTMLSGGRAGSVVALPLTIHPGNTVGSEPATDPPGWDDVRRFDYEISDNEQPARRRPRFWRKIHLLNKDFHGPGEVWNLAPGHEKDNSWMRDNPEAHARARLHQPNSVLFYESAATYFSAADSDTAVPVEERVTITNFVSRIRIAWGTAKWDAAKKEWLKDQKIEDDDHIMVKPPLTLQEPHKIDIKRASRGELLGLGLRRGLVNNIMVEEKISPFKGRADFLSRMETRYSNDHRNERDRRSFLTDPDFWPAIEGVIAKGEAIL